MRLFLFAMCLFIQTAFASTPQSLKKVAYGGLDCSGLPAVTTVTNGRVYAWCSDGQDEDAFVRVFDPISGNTLLDWQPKPNHYQCKDFYAPMTNRNNGFMAYSCVSEDWKSYAVAIRSISSGDSTDTVVPVGTFWAFINNGNQFISGNNGALYINDVANNQVSTRPFAQFNSDVKFVSVVNSGRGIVVQADSHLYYYDAVSFQQKWQYTLPNTTKPADRFWIGIAGGSRYVVLAYRTDLFGTYELVTIDQSNGTSVARNEWKYDPQHSDQMIVAEPSSIEVSDDESIISMHRNGLPHGMYIFDTNKLKLIYQNQDSYDQPANFSFDPSSKTIIGYYVSKTAKTVGIHDILNGSDTALTFDDSSVSDRQVELYQLPYMLDANHLLSAGFGGWTTYLLH